MRIRFHQSLKRRLRTRNLRIFTRLRMAMAASDVR